MGRTTFAGTDEPNLEAKGVVPDVRVPITLETEQAKQRGEDPVLDAAIAELDRLTNPATKLLGATWQWKSEISGSGAETKIDGSTNYSVTFDAEEERSYQADCNRANGTYTLGENSELTIALGPSTLALCPGDSRGEDFLKLLNAATSITFQGEQLAILLNPESGTLGLLFEQAETD
ncbi:MAG: META domain-containing protein [Caldilineaceae bacterium]